MILQSRHAGWFQIPYLGSCPPSTDGKISLISSVKCLASLIREPVFFQIHTGSIDIGFSKKYANFIHRQGATVYKAHG